jgi:hypothetical protein
MRLAGNRTTLWLLGSKALLGDAHSLRFLLHDLDGGSELVERIAQVPSMIRTG